MKTMLCKIKLSLENVNIFYKSLIEGIIAIRMNPGKPMLLKFD